MTAPLRKHFGDRVKELRLASGMSQEAFADKCGFARSYMSRIERGKANPSLDAVEVFAEALGVMPCDLFDTSKDIVSTAATAILVPFASDGTYFNPSLRRPTTGKFVVGKKEDEVTFESFDAALEYLRMMGTAHWRRPNVAGNWGTVSATRWDLLPKEYLTS